MKVNEKQLEAKPEDLAMRCLIASGIMNKYLDNFWDILMKDELLVIGDVYAIDSDLCRFIMELPQKISKNEKKNR